MNNKFTNTEIFTNDLKTVKKDTILYFEEGIYRLNSPIIFDESYSNVCIEGKGNVEITGSKIIEPMWKTINDNIKYCVVEDDVDALYIDNKKYIMARYPNYDENIDIFNGYSADCISKERVSNWTNPIGGYIHAMHKHHWGDYHYEITGKDNENNLIYHGGWQNNRQMGMHSHFKFVENIFEELDVEGEWYFDKQNKRIYVYPYKGADISKIEIVTLSHLVEFRDCKNITFKNITFTKTARTFMETKEPLLRSDWTIYRGGVAFFNNATNCTIENCNFTDVGSNAVFVDGNNNGIAIKSCLFDNVGASGVCFVGRSDSVRSPLFEYNEVQNFKDIDLVAGPKNDNYPKNCSVEDCLITRIGRVEKQSAGVQISMAMDITISHCSIYNVPRAGINISEGAFGGNIIEHCDVFDTVKETGDHGSFNSWGRDRYWHLDGVDGDHVIDYALLDVVKPITIRNNRFRCDKGWDIDLDDGSSNYHIYNNLCLNGGIKLREGFYRKVENNITVNNSVHFHVWYENSGDIVQNNIVFEPYKPIGMPNRWGKCINHNILHTSGTDGIFNADELKGLSNQDEASVKADCQFSDIGLGDYTVNNKQIKGFVNFPMYFGVISERLKALAKKPELPLINLSTPQISTVSEIMGLHVKNIDTQGEMSVHATAGLNGVLVVDIFPHSPFCLKGIKKNDVIININDKDVNNVEELFGIEETLKDVFGLKITVLRSQKFKIL